MYSHPHAAQLGEQSAASLRSDRTDFVIEKLKH
jgi:hypothetical protein